MIKKAFSLLFLLLVLLGAAAGLKGVNAQEADQTKRWFCFQAAHCNKPESNCTTSSGHRAKLTIGSAADERPLPNHETIIVECLSTAEGQKCTTGNTNLDNQLYGGSQMGGINYTFQGLFAEDGVTPISQPLPGNASGNLAPMEWQDATPQGHSRKWLGLNLVEPKEDFLGQGGQQLDTFDFETALKKCVPIAWDPAGRIFDSQSLEPVPAAQVTLLKKRDGGIFSYVNPLNPDDVPGGALVNPYHPTLADGWFSFVVIDGTYKLNVQSSTHKFPSTASLNPNYKSAYSNIYPSMTGAEIVQAGSIQYRDIPVDPKGPPVNTDPEIIEYSYESDKLNSVLLSGKVSHPLSTVSIYSVITDSEESQTQTRYRLLTTVSADRYGYFSVTVDQSDFDKEIGEMFGEIEVTKVDLSLASGKKNLIQEFMGYIKNLIIKDVEAQTSSSTTLKLDPIPTYLEGIAMNSQGTVMSNAKIGIYLNFTTKAYYETTADENGYFKINTDNIPFQPYKLRYSSPQGSVLNVTTTKFLADNSEYIKDNKIDPFKPNYANPDVNEKIEEKLALTGAAQQNQNLTETPLEPETGLPLQYTFVGMVIFILLLLVAVGAVVYFMVKKKKEVMY